MALLDFSGVGFGYSDERVIVEASGTLEAGNIVGLVGANGGGKTTLLKLIIGELSPEDGHCTVARNTNVAYVSQGSPLSLDATLHGWVRGGRADLVKLSEQISKSQHGLASQPDDLELLARLSKLEEQFNALDGHMWEHNVLRLLTGIGFREEQHRQLLSELSGGQQQKANLARALINGASCYIFDEPTNHLDLAAQAFFVSYLKQLPRTTGIILVSHDRWLLDALCTHIWELDTGVLYRYPGNYTKHVPARELRRKQARLAYARQREHIAKTEDFIRRNIAGQKTKLAQSRRTLLGRMERMDRPGEDPQMSFVLTPRLRTGEQLLLAENLTFAYGLDSGDGNAEPPPVNVAAGPAGLNLNPPLHVERSSAKGEMLFADVSFSVYRGERLGIVGPNGCGKTTILKLLARQIPPVRGLLAWGSNAELGVFSQDSSDLIESNNLLAELRRVEPGISDGAARSYLGRFGFSGDDVYAECVSLSGGERNRLSLAKIFYQRPNVLLLDEPTNHLDIYAREALEQFLVSYQGSVIMVTHDRALLERLCDRLLIFDAWDAEAAVTFYRGGYRDYLVWKERTAADDPAPGGKTTGTCASALPDPAEPERLSVDDVELLAGQARTSAVAYCSKHVERSAHKQAELEALIKAHDASISKMRDEQDVADAAQNYDRLSELQVRIEALHREVDGLLGQIIEVATIQDIWMRLGDDVAAN